MNPFLNNANPNIQKSKEVGIGSGDFIFRTFSAENNNQDFDFEVKMLQNLKLMKFQFVSLGKMFGCIGMYRKDVYNLPLILIKQKKNSK